MPQSDAPSPLRAAAPSAVAVLAVLALGCSPALETPPLGPDAAGPDDATGPADVDAGLEAGGADAAQDARAPNDGGLLQVTDAGPSCTDGDVRACDCGQMLDDGSPIPGLELCAGGVFDPCRCAEPDGGPTVVPPTGCGADAYSGTLTGTLSFAGINSAEVQPRAKITAVELTLLPIDSDGRRAVSGTIHATVGGLADLDGELHGYLSCRANPPTLSTQATAGFGWLGTQYTLSGEFSADLTAGALSKGNWFLGGSGGSDPSADGLGSWSAMPR